MITNPRADSGSVIFSTHKINLLQLTDDFEAWLLSDGLTTGSIRNFIAQYREFGQFCLEKGIAVQQIATDAARSYLAYLRDRPNHHTGEPLSTSTRRKHYYTLIRIGDFLKEKKLIEANVNLVSGIRKPTRKQTVIHSFTSEQLQAIINEARNQRTSPRYKDRTSLLLFLLASTGLRISEALNLKLCDIDNDRRIMIVLGKGNKEREVPFSPKLSSLILEYASIYKIERNDYLFASRYGKPLAPSSVRDFLRKAKKALGTYHGIDRMRVSPHTFRHTFARLWVVQGGNTIALSRIMGHTSTAMTDKYVRLWGLDLNKAYDLCDPCAVITVNGILSDK